jgi:hypothetical protein
LLSYKFPFLLEICFVLAVDYAQGERIGSARIGIFGNKTVTFRSWTSAGPTRAVASGAALLFHKIARQLLLVVGH